MSTRPDNGQAAYIWDALTAARNVGLFVADIAVERYVGDLLLESATERQLEIVGEALRNLRRVDKVTAERIPHVHKIIGMRNISCSWLCPGGQHDRLDSGDDGRIDADTRA